jgi:hypothetical protein
MGQRMGFSLASFAHQQKNGPPQQIVVDFPRASYCDLQIGVNFPHRVCERVPQILLKIGSGGPVQKRPCVLIDLPAFNSVHGMIYTRLLLPILSEHPISLGTNPGGYL